MSALTTTDLKGALPLVARGKVRDIYGLDENHLLFVATDRISAFDVIMSNGIIEKGKILTQLSDFWFKFLSDICPNHLVSINLDDIAEPAKSKIAPYKDQLEGRSMIVRKYRILPIEAIVRGYITGSGWNEYKAKGTVHGINLPKGLVESEKLKTPLFTPSTKAELGQHDENIHPSQAAELIGKENAEKVEKLAIQLYKKAADYAASKGIIIADTKFEFGIDDQTGDIILVDEVLTPDSSRFWRADSYKPGQAQDSYDKQYLRNWLIANGLKAKENVSMTPQVAEKTREKYIEAYETLTGKKWV